LSDLGTGTPPAGGGGLFVVSAPSGAGKTSLVRAVIERRNDACATVSYTTRRPRSSEVAGREYHFIDQARFAVMRDQGEFLEWAEVFGNYYGTSRAQVQSLVAAGKRVILEIDWQGARQVRERMPDASLVFVLPPSPAELERRLRTRATDEEEVIRRRLREARDDMSHWHEFDFVIVNDDFEQAVGDMLAILDGRGERLRTDPAAPPAPFRHIAP
jgi:guanylate kinase